MDIAAQVRSATEAATEAADAARRAEPDAYAPQTAREYVDELLDKTDRGLPPADMLSPHAASPIPEPPAREDELDASARFFYPALERDNELELELEP